MKVDFVGKIEKKAISLQLPGIRRAQRAAARGAGAIRYKLTPGMQVAAEIHLGSHSVLEYLLSPV